MKISFWKNWRGCKDKNFIGSSGAILNYFDLKLILLKANFLVIYYGMFGTLINISDRKINYFHFRYN